MMLIEFIPLHGEAAILGTATGVRVDGIPTKIALGQFDGNPKPEIVALSDSGENGPALTILRNRGDGTFSTTRSFVIDPARYIVHSMAVGDFTGDQISDVVVAATDLDAPGLTSALLLFKGDGVARLEAAETIASTGQFPTAIALGDLNHDGLLDVVLCDSRPSDGSGQVSIFRGQRVIGAAPFAKPTTIAAGSLLNQVLIDDFDADGSKDVVLLDSAEGQLLGIFGAAAGVGTPSVLASFDMPDSMVGLFADGDDRLDLVASSSSARELKIYLQNTPREFVSRPGLVDPEGFASLGSGDFNADGYADVLAVNRGGDQVTVLGGNESGAFEPLESSDLLNAVGEVLVGQLNDDQLPDVVFARDEEELVTVILNALPPPRTATATPSPTATPILTATPGSLVGDANCDGRVNGTDLPALIDRIFETGCARADVNDDARVSAADLIAIQRFL